MATGFLNRVRGKELFTSACGQLLGKGVAISNGGGNIQGGQFVGAVGNGNDATEDLLWSYALPANSFDQASRALQFYAWGTFANNAHAKTARFYFGTSIVIPDAYSTSGAVVPWVISGMIVKSGAKLQQGSAQIIAAAAHGGALDLSGTEDDTNQIIIKLTGQTGTAAANDVVLKGVNLQFLN